jgi:uncharacterized protein (DUF2336 family)
VRDPMLSDFPFLASLASSESPKDRRIWLRVATDHFVAAKSIDPGKMEEFIDAMTAQLNAADPSTRLDVARKLAPCARAPTRLLGALTSVDSEACDYLFEHAVAFTRNETEQAVAHGGRRAIAVAKRSDLDPSTVAALAAQDDILVLIALATNESARVEGAMRLDVIRRARRLAEDKGDRRLADAVLQRGQKWPESASLFLCARPSQRIEILLAAQRSRLGRPFASSIPATSALLEELEFAAVARQPEQFLALLAKALDYEPQLARKIVDDPTGEPLAVALAALGAANEVLVRILISNDLIVGAAYQRIRALTRLNNALDRSAARMIVAALRDEAGANRHRSPKAGAKPVPALSRDAPPAGIAKKAYDPPRALWR